MSLTKNTYLTKVMALLIAGSLLGPTIACTHNRAPIVRNLITLDGTEIKLSELNKKLLNINSKQEQHLTIILETEEPDANCKAYFANGSKKITAAYAKDEQIAVYLEPTNGATHGTCKLIITAINDRSGVEQKKDMAVSIDIPPPTPVVPIIVPTIVPTIVQSLNEEELTTALTRAVVTSVTKHMLLVNNNQDTNPESFFKEIVIFVHDSNQKRKLDGYLGLDTYSFKLLENVRAGALAKKFFQDFTKLTTIDNITLTDWKELLFIYNNPAKLPKLDDIHKDLDRFRNNKVPNSELNEWKNKNRRILNPEPLCLSFKKCNRYHRELISHIVVNCVIVSCALINEQPNITTEAHQEALDKRLTNIISKSINELELAFKQKQTDWFFDNYNGRT